MNNELSVEERNRMVIMLVQALLGAVSPNFRMVAMFPTISTVKFRFILERDNADDREEIEDVLAESDALQDHGRAKFDVDVVVSAEPLTLLELPWIAVYLRRENLIS
jgi:hypothetical protein